MSIINRSIGFILQSTINLISYAATPAANWTVKKTNRLVSDLGLDGVTKYFPQENKALIESSINSTIQAADQEKDCVMSALQIDTLAIVILNLDPVSFAQFCKTCKYCYSISKESLFWKNLFMQNLPKIVPSVSSSLSTEYQFKIVFKQFAQLRCPLKAHQAALKVEILGLRGPNGFDGRIDEKWKHYDEFNQHYIQFSPAVKFQTASALSDLYSQYSVLHFRLKDIAGDHFQGTNETVDPSSELGKVIGQIESNEQMFTDQTEFETFVRIVELKNGIERS